MICAEAKSQLSANFKADLTSGCPPFVVQFTDLSTGSPTSYLWDLGNGTTSTQKDPGTIYFNPGQYTVKLIIKSGSGADSIVKSQYIFVSSLPVVDFSVNSNSGCAPFDVKFTNLSTPGSGTITGWDWDFGDGATASTASPNHQYVVSGDFTVTLRITNSNGCNTIVTKSALIHVDPSPIADFSSVSTSSCNPPVTINFSNTSIGPYTSSAWTFGDGNSSTSPNPSNNYSVAGTYIVSLIVNNSFGCADTVSRATVIGSVSADFSVQDTICEGTPVVFNNTSSGTVSSFWSFGDGTTASVINPVKIFTKSGPFTVKLVNNFGACKDSVAKQILVIKKPVASFTFVSPTVGCAIPVTVSFSSTSVGAVSYKWYFGDGGTSTSINPNHTYTALGIYTVSLVVTNASGCKDSLAKPSIISILPPEITGFNNLPYKGCIPHTQIFSANIVTSEPVQRYLWNFGDGITSNAANPQHLYSTSGIYNVSLVINTVSGCKDTFLYKGAIVIGSKPNVNFDANPKVSCAHDPIQFSDLSTGVVNVWSWQFGDGGSSSAQNPLYTYKDTGFFNVTLIVGDYYCFDTITFSDFVYIKPPIARMDIRFNCDTPFTRKFSNRSISNLTTQWTFGDGGSSTAANPVHTYATPGIYDVKLYVTNGACFDEVIIPVYIIDENPDFIHDSLACKNTSVVFTVTNAILSNLYDYKWDFGDGTAPITTLSPSITKRYSVSGVYSPQLIINDLNGCLDTIIHPLRVKILGPRAAYLSPAGACIGDLVGFSDRSTPFGGFSIIKWIWAWGDGNIDTLTGPPFIHRYVNAGFYNVRLIVVDSYGCKDTLLKQNIIQITKPNAAFSITDTISCRNSIVEFVNNSSGSNLTYNWSFGDGGTSNASNPSYSYSTFGSYNVKLTVKDRYGCIDTISKNNLLTIANPLVGFSMSDSTISCPPTQINFINQSSFFTSVKWDFDDGSFSTLNNPSHFFRTAKTFNIKLVVKGYGACSDSIIKQLKVKGPSGTLSYAPQLACVNTTINFVANAQNNNYFTWDFGDGSTVVTTTSTISHVYATQGKFVPKVLLQDTTLNCVVPIIGTDTIFVTGALAKIGTFKDAFCDSATIRFLDSSIVQYDTVANYTWRFGDGTTSTQKNVTHTFNSTGIYNITLRVSTTGGCIDSTSRVLKIVASPIAIITGPDSACINSTTNFLGGLSQPDTSVIQWTWTFGNGGISSGQPAVSQVFSSAGNFVIRALATNSTGCTDSIMHPIQILPLPTINAGNDTSICRGNVDTLYPSGGANYIWQSHPTLSCTNCTNPAASPLDIPVTYVVTGASSFGCLNKDSITISVIQPFNISVSNHDSLCLGQSVKLSVSGTDKYEWTPIAGIDNPASNNPSVKPDTTTKYMVVGIDNKNCFRDTAYINVTVFPVPTFNIVPDNISIASGSNVTLTTTNSADINSWQWTPTTALSCVACREPIASPNLDITYTAVVTNSGGCTAQDKVSISITCGEGNLYMPNTFSPNNDGMNDVFYPRGKGIAGIKLLRIFNRWGALVFERSNFAANDVSAGWVGTYRNQSLTPDVFVYMIEVICGNGQMFNYKGNVTLVR